MRSRLLLALALLPILLSAAAAGEVRRGLAVASPVLGRPIPYTLYLPDDRGAGGRLPVLYLLHGHGGTERDWLDAGGLEATMDRLVATGAVPPMLVVMPGLGDGWYVDNPDRGGQGAVATAFLADLLPAIDRTWPTDARRQGRALAGLSMGGWGAIRLALLRPDLFAAAASLSGALVTEAQAATPLWAGFFSGVFGDPVDLVRFRAAAPQGMLAALPPAPMLPALYLACGDDDELGLTESNLLFFLALARAGVPAELRIGDGGHDWSVWSRDLAPALRFVGAALTAARAAP
jgi:enterochelin esterase family protein